jgi:3-mercaptopyruvate sulfurtransferase SseA
MSDYAYPAVLVDTQWVAEHWSDPKVRIVEVGYSGIQNDTTIVVYGTRRHG